MLKLTSITLLLFLAGCQSSDPSFRGTELGDSIPTTDFTLTDQYKQPFTLGDHKGKVVLLFFGFTYCPDVCPLTLSTWKKVQDALKDDVAQVEFVYITVDPERDTSEKIASHLAVFSPDFTQSATRCRTRPSSRPPAPLSPPPRDVPREAPS